VGPSGFGTDFGFTQNVPVAPVFFETPKFAETPSPQTLLPITFSPQALFQETPVAETQITPVTPISFDMSKFTSPAFPGANGENISAIPQEPSATPYIDFITGLSNTYGPEAEVPVEKAPGFWRGIPTGVPTFSDLIQQAAEKVEPQYGYQFPNVSPKEYFKGVNVQSLPAGMRNNNIGNIKYSSWSSKLPGAVGPSQNKDQGDPQVVFNSPEAGVAGTAALALNKYNRGLTSVSDLITSTGGDNKPGGWTPGNTAAAANIAKTMGVGLYEDINLSDPVKMQSFVRALATQEHGPSSSLFTDNTIRTGVNSVLGGTSDVVAAKSNMLNSYAPAPDNFSPTFDSRNADFSSSLADMAKRDSARVEAQKQDAAKAQEEPSMLDKYGRPVVSTMIDMATGMVIPYYGLASTAAKVSNLVMDTEIPTVGSQVSNAVFGAPPQKAMPTATPQRLTGDRSITDAPSAQGTPGSLASDIFYDLYGQATTPSNGDNSEDAGPSGLGTDFGYLPPDYYKYSPSAPAPTSPVSVQKSFAPSYPASTGTPTRPSAQSAFIPPGNYSPASISAGGGGGGGAGAVKSATTTATTSSQRPVLNVDALYGLDKFLSAQSASNAPSNISPYVAPFATTTTRRAIPDFYSIRYPTSST
jgi:hypothetical protein